jgi:serine/threonine protein kinase
MDIKSGNIMIEPVQHHPILIDFGISVYWKELNPSSAFYVYDTYTPWCFEIFVCNYIVQKIQLKNADNEKVSAKKIADLIKQFQYGTQSHKTTQNSVFSTTIIPVSSLEQLRKNLETYMSVFLDKPWKYVYEHLILETHATWDSYALGVLCLRVIDSFKEDEPERFHSFTAVKNGTLAKEYIEILHNSVFVAPNNRLTIEDTIARLQKLAV